MSLQKISRVGHYDGRTAHPLYKTWENMIARCENERATQFADYGGRGITVCDAWRHDFRAFLADVGERPAGCTLDRIDNDGPYAPGNVRWETRSNQNRTGRNRRGSSHHGAKLTEEQVVAIDAGLRAGRTQQSLADEHGVSRSSVLAIREGRSWSHVTGRKHAA